MQTSWERAVLKWNVQITVSGRRHKVKTAALLGQASIQNIFQSLHPSHYRGLNGDPPRTHVHALSPGACECYFIWIKDLKDLRTSRWDHLVLSKLGPKCSKCPYERDRGETHRGKRRRPCDDRGRDWSDVLISQRTPGATRSWRRQRKILC